MGFHFELLIVFGLILAEVAAVMGVVYLAVRFMLRAMRGKRSRAVSPR